MRSRPVLLVLTGIASVQLGAAFAKSMFHEASPSAIASKWASAASSGRAIARRSDTHANAAAAMPSAIAPRLSARNHRKRLWVSS